MNSIKTSKSQMKSGSASALLLELDRHFIDLQ